MFWVILCFNFTEYSTQEIDDKYQLTTSTIALDCGNYCIHSLICACYVRLLQQINNAGLDQAELLYVSHWYDNILRWNMGLLLELVAHLHMPHLLKFHFSLWGGMMNLVIYNLNT